eukprot:TRINITY_DN40692_c0_g1_i2.p2 TRINITY_DN40692_c0_g1~~TRINITY_DN40692_c0_g1_i2.p2  ORF type:complete len:263 (-),score=28.39 TRINITY_DN40692_c0_g1_i2:19-807(-)
MCRICSWKWRDEEGQAIVALVVHVQACRLGNYWRVGSGDEIRYDKLGWTALGTFGAAACANTLNQVIETKRDALMRRTMKRPLPSGRLSRQHALLFAAAMGVTGISILYTQLNQLTASLGFANIVLYAGIYTPLKVMTVANTWVGAVVGAIPPMMGWTAACNRVDPGSVVPAMILFFWQIPHFLALAWLSREDYARAGYKMVTTVDGLKLKAGLVCIRNSFYLLPMGLAAVGMGLTKPWDFGTFTQWQCYAYENLVFAYSIL